MKYQLIILLLPALAFTWSCQSDGNTITDLNNLEFETDSVIFDTVFTTVGSATEVFSIYNKSSDKLL
ncbi:MAG: hypothetical protein ACPGLV_13070, partial [Bacteroidia bacterium]